MGGPPEPARGPRREVPEARPTDRSVARGDRELHALVLEVVVLGLLDVSEPMAPVDLALEVPRPADAQPHAHARERIRARIRAVRVPRAADVGGGRELHLDPAFRRAPDREAQFERGREAVVADELVLAIAAHGLVAAERELLEREERLARELEVGAEDRLDAPGIEAAHPL